MATITTVQYIIAFAVMTIGFLPIGYTALFTSHYLPLEDYICAMAGFILAVHITEWNYDKQED